MAKPIRLVQLVPKELKQILAKPMGSSWLVVGPIKLAKQQLMG